MSNHLPVKRTEDLRQEGKNETWPHEQAPTPPLE